MAVSPFKVFISGEVLTASDLNSSFSQVFDNGQDLGWPATKAKDFDGYELVLDSDGDTSITADTDDQIDFKIGGADELSLTAAKANNLNDIAALTPTNQNVILGNGTDWISSTVPTVITTRGDLIRGDSSGNSERLAIGSERQILTPDPNGDLIYENRIPLVSQTGTATLTLSDMEKNHVCTGAAFTLTLPDTTDSGIDGKVVTITNKGGNAYQVAPDASDNIQNCSGNIYLPKEGESVILQADSANTEWRIIGGTFSASFIDVYRTTDQAVNNNTYTKIQFDAETEDESASYDNSTNHRFQPKISGRFKVEANSEILSITDGSNFELCIYKNGSLFSKEIKIVGGSGTIGGGISDELRLTTSDYIEIYIFQNSGTTKNLAGGSTKTFLRSSWLGF